MSVIFVAVSLAPIDLVFSLLRYRLLGGRISKRASVGEASKNALTAVRTSADHSLYSHMSVIAAVDHEAGRTRGEWVSWAMHLKHATLISNPGSSMR